MSSGGKLEVLVLGISIGEAKEQIIDATDLNPDVLTVMEFISSNFKYLCRMGSGPLPSMLSFNGKRDGDREETRLGSMVAGFVGSRDGEHHFAITSAHYSGKGKTYYFSGHNQEKLMVGTCTDYYHEDQQEVLDVAFIELMKDIPKEKMVNVIKLPSPGLKDYVPQVWRGDLKDAARRELEALKHGPRGLVRGNLTLVKDQQDKHMYYIAFVTTNWQAGTCTAGDSGSLITSLPGTGNHVEAYGIVSGLYTVTAGGSCVKQFCVISPLQPALADVEQRRNVDLEFVRPIMSPSDADDHHRGHDTVNSMNFSSVNHPRALGGRSTEHLPHLGQNVTGENCNYRGYSPSCVVLNDAGKETILNVLPQDAKSGSSTDEQTDEGFESMSM